MKRLLLLMGITAGCIAANAQAPTAPKTAPKPTKYSKDADLSRLVIDLNLKGGGLMQKYSLTNENLYNSAVVYNRGELKFNNGMSFGGDLQLGVFLGKNRHFGIGTGILYFSQSGEATMENFNVANKETDSKGNAYRQIITATDKITEKLTITNINLPLVLKYKNRLNTIL